MPNAQCLVCPMPHAQCPVCPMPHAQCPVCPMPHAQCPMPNALFAQCPMPHALFAQCPMPNAQCPMPNAQCPMPHARRVPHVTEKGYIYLCLSNGILTIKVVPKPVSLENSIWPPCKSTHCFTMDKPSPVPGIFPTFWAR